MNDDEGAVLGICTAFVTLLTVFAIGTVVNYMNERQSQEELPSSGSITVTVPHDPPEITRDVVPGDIPFCYDAYRIRDRQSGMEWLLLVMSESTHGNEYVVLPIEDGER